MYQVRKVFTFEAAHRLESAYSKTCTAGWHGHSYQIEVFAKSRELNKDGMVIDFKKLKEIVQPLVNALDHSLILTPNQFAAMDKKGIGKVFAMETNTTAENIAKMFFKHIKSYTSLVSKVRVHETATGFSEYWEE